MAKNVASSEVYSHQTSTDATKMMSTETTINADINDDHDTKTGKDETKLKRNSGKTINRWLELGHKCAKLMEATCVSE